jgi:hypothetical protein
MLPLRLQALQRDSESLDFMPGEGESDPGSRLPRRSRLAAHGCVPPHSCPSWPMPNVMHARTHARIMSRDTVPLL